MTVENRRYIAASDVLALAVECRNARCGIRSTFPIKSATSVPAQCPYCGTMWFEQEGERDNSIRNLSKAIRNLSKDGATATMEFFIMIPGDGN